MAGEFTHFNDRLTILCAKNGLAYPHEIVKNARDAPRANTRAGFRRGFCENRVKERERKRVDGARGGTKKRVVTASCEAFMGGASASMDLYGHGVCSEIDRPPRVKKDGSDESVAKSVNRT